MNIEIKTVDYYTQRYSSLGDYFYKDNDVLRLRISDTGNKNFNFLIALHEFIEWFITEQRGINEGKIYSFDVDFEKKRELGIYSEDEEPGDHPTAPYRKEHRFAENIERIVAHELGIDFNDYTNYLIQFIDEKEKNKVSKSTSNNRTIDPKIGK